MQQQSEEMYCIDFSCYQISLALGLVMVRGLPSLMTNSKGLPDSHQDVGKLAAKVNIRVCPKRQCCYLSMDSTLFSSVCVVRLIKSIHSESQVATFLKDRPRQFWQCVQYLIFHNHNALLNNCLTTWVSLAVWLLKRNSASQTSKQFFYALAISKPKWKIRTVVWATLFFLRQGVL